jgi:effector-binding domain-containing protein
MAMLLTVLLPAQEKTEVQLPQMPLNERLRLPEIKDITPFTYAYLECKGSYAQIPAKINEFMGLFFKQGLIPLGNFFATYLNSPQQVKEEELQWRLGFPVNADATVAAPLEKGEFKATKAAVYLYIGPYENIGYAYGKIHGFCEQQGYSPIGPTIEKYLDPNPQAVKPEELRTEVNVPVLKKK